MPQNKVFFKGKGRGLIIVLDTNSTYEELRAELMDKSEKSKTFFTGACEDIRFEGKELTGEQENELADIIISRAGMEIGFINPENNENFATKKRDTTIPLTDESPEPQNDALKPAQPVQGELPPGVIESGEKVLVYNGFVRSGKLVESDGNVVILGGINPGGEVFAGRNIIVFGPLKGKAVAGGNGDENCFITAILMEPELLGISKYVTRFPDSKKNDLNKTPSIARLKTNKIVISAISGVGAVKA